MGPGHVKPHLRQAPSPTSPGFWKAGLYPSQVGKGTHDGVLFSDGGPQDQARAMPALWVLRQEGKPSNPGCAPEEMGRVLLAASSVWVTLGPAPAGGEARLSWADSSPGSGFHFVI